MSPQPHAPIDMLTALLQLHTESPPVMTPHERPNARPTLPKLQPPTLSIRPVACRQQRWESIANMALVAARTRLKRRTHSRHTTVTMRAPCFFHTLVAPLALSSSLFHRIAIPTSLYPSPFSCPYHHHHVLIPQRTSPRSRHFPVAAVPTPNAANRNMDSQSI
ncbi:hypothetical protein BOTBODRAFT_176234 [Botryobasidium botryosum FD-172 SS1]|uniref:Uncharacterized protein n=1 Tax=Botryobasidium botryosum (strain FD-172 SS1) TaxID=930990 RepID=A0A067MAS7_BOTB1|nr:hypothetical protein BOTBODRAFT_176234 [Botryobasidium botryosum FD-172 SS1]